MSIDEKKVINFFSILLILFLAGIAVIQTNPLEYLPGRDGGYFLYAGDQILQSKIPYRDFWDSKPPLIFYVNALALVIGKGTQWGIFLFEYLSIAFSAIFCFFAIQKRWGAVIGNISVGVGLLVLTQFLGEGNYTEEFSMAFNSAAVFLFLSFYLSSKDNWILAAIGGLTGFSFLFRANNIGIEIAIFLAVGIESLIRKDFKRLFKQFIFGLSGFLIVAGLISVYFAYYGYLIELWQASVLYNFFYAERLGFGLQSIFAFIRYIPALSVLLIIGVAYAIREIYQEFKRGEAFTFGIFLIAAITIEVILATLSGRGFNHYYIGFVPIFCYVAAYLLSKETKVIGALDLKLSNPQIIRLFSIIFIILVVLFNKEMKRYFNIGERLLFERERGIEIIPEIASYIDRNSEKGEVILIWGSQMGFNYFSETTALSTYGWYPMYVDSPVSDLMFDQFLIDLVEKKPAIIVDSYKHSPDTYISLNRGTRSWQLNKPGDGYYLPDNIWDVLDYIEDNYYFYENIDGYDVYLLK